MLTQQQTPTVPEIIYPESDGKPVADNTEQFHWIATIKENLELLFSPFAEVFVAGDLLWYPVGGNNRRLACPRDLEGRRDACPTPILRIPVS